MIIKLAIQSFGYASRAMAMPQRPSERNVRLVYPFNYVKTYFNVDC